MGAPKSGPLARAEQYSFRCRCHRYGNGYTTLKYKKKGILTIPFSLLFSLWFNLGFDNLFAVFELDYYCRFYRIMVLVHSYGSCYSLIAAGSR